MLLFLILLDFAFLVLVVVTAIKQAAYTEFGEKSFKKEPPHAPYFLQKLFSRFQK